MEKMPFIDRIDTVPANPVISIESDWRRSLPVLTGRSVTLRELRVSDAPVLLAMLATEEVAPFISPPPTSVRASSVSSPGRTVNAPLAATFASGSSPREWMSRSDCSR